MNILKLQDGVKVPINFDATRLIIRNDIEMLHIRLEPAQKLDLHKNPADVIFFVLDGEGLFTCENQSRIIGKDTTVFVDKSELRSWENTGKIDLRLLAIKLLAK